MSRRCSLLAPLWFLSLVLIAALALAADDAPSEPPLRFRRVHVPADRLPDVPRDDKKLVPVEAAKFEEMIRTLGSFHRELTPSTTLAQAEYIGTWDGETLSGTLKFETGAITGPRRIPLLPLSLVLSDYRWAGRDVPPIVATGADGVLTLLADRSGTFEAAWNTIGVRPAVGGIEFHLQLPPAPIKRFLLDLPAGWGLSTDVGTVTANERDVSRAGRWTVELGGHERATLHLFRRDAMAQSRRLPLVRTATSYEFTGRGINVGSIWRLESHDEPLREVSFVLDPGLQLIGAQYGETSLDWTLETEAANSSTRVTLRLPQPIQGVARPLRLEAVGSAVIDRTDPLPRLHPIGLAWQEGSLTTIVPEPFVIEQFEPLHCRQVRTSPLPEPLSGESIELQSFAPDATVRWRIGRTTTRLRVDQGTSLMLLEGTTTAQIVLAGRVDSGERFNLTANVAPTWTVESVDSSPPGRVSDWTLEPQGKSGVTLLSIRLREPVTPTEPVRLVISARGAAQAAQERLKSTDLQPLQLPRTTVESHLLAIAAATPWRVQIDDDYDLTRLTRDGLTQPELELLQTVDNAQIVRLDGHASPWQVRIEPRRSQSNARIDVDVTVDAALLHEAYTITSQPGLDPIERLLVHFTHGRVEPPQWRFQGNHSGEFRVRRLTAEQQTGLELPVAGETWEVTLLQPQRESFTLRAQRRTPLTAESPVSLAVLPEIIDQQGRLMVRAEADIPLVIDNHRLEATYPRHTSKASHTLRQMYVYDPRRTLAGDAGPAVTVRRETTSSASTSAVIEHAEHDVAVEPSGVIRQQITWQVRNHGRAQLTLESVDESAQITAVRVNDELIELDHGEPELYVPLPSGADRVTVQVWVETKIPAFRWGRAVNWSTIEVDAPILSQRATLWLPPGYRTNHSLGTHDGLGQTVVARWFGWLRRGADQKRFDPTSSDSWHALISGEPIESRAVADLALGKLAALETQPAARTGDGIFTAWQASLAENGVTLWIPDTLRLTLPQSPSPVWLGATERGWRWLRSQSLALVVGGQSIAVLPLDDARRNTDLLTAVDGTAIYTLVDSTTSGNDSWARLIAAHSTLRPVSTDAKAIKNRSDVYSAQVSSHVDHLGWRPVSIDGLAPSATVTVVDDAWVAGWSWCGFLLALAGLIFLIRRNGEWHTLASIGLLSFALAAPANWVPWVAATSAAVMASTVVRCLRTIRGSPVKQVSHGGSRLSARLATAAGSLLLALSIASPVWSQTPEASRDKGESIPKVFIPYDDENKPTGTYHVPDRFYAELRRRLAAAAGSADDWYLTAANYRLEFSHNAEQDALELDELRASYKLHVAAPGVTLRLPVWFATTNNEPVEAVLGGSELTLKLDPQRKYLEGVCPEAGDLELILTLQPKVGELDDRKRVQLTIPPVADASIEVHLPSDAAPVDVLGALGEWEHSADHRVSTAALGPLKELDVRWPKRGARQGSSMLDIAELAWLRIRPGSVSAELTLRVRVAGGVCRSVPLVVDPHWRLLPGKEENRIASIETRAVNPAQPDAPRSLLVHLREPTTEPFNLRLSFLQVGASGIGVVRVPTIESAGGRTTRRWLALNVDSALDHEFNSPDAVVVAVEDFVEQWGAAGALPQLVLDRSSATSAVQVTTRPKEPLLEVAQRLSLSAVRDGFDVRFDADVTISNAATFQLRVNVPKELVVENVSVLDDGVQRVARWSPLGDGVVVVFLNGPASGLHELSLRGFLPLPNTAVVAVPTISIQEAKTTDAKITVLRDPAVLVTTEQVQGYDDVETPEAPPAPWRQVAQWQVTGERPAAKLRVRLNDPRTNIVQLTTLRWDSRQWLADVELIAGVEEGSLDRLRFEVPRSWSGPFTLSPPLDYELTELPQQNYQLLTVTPVEPARDLLRLKITSPLKLGEGQLAAWPGARPLVNGTIERYIRLPHSWGPRSITWDTEGMRSASLPEALATSLTDVTHETFRVIANRVSAQLRQKHDRNQTAKVLLAEVQYSLLSHDRWGGSVRFEVDPAGLEALLLSLPLGCELLQASVDDFVQTPRYVNDRCLIPLVGDLPQSVEVQFQARVEPGANSSRRARLAAPMVDGVPVLNTVWLDRSSTDAWQPVTGERTQIDAYRLALVRWQAWLALFEQATSGSTVRVAEEWKTWSAQSWRRLQAVHAEVELRRVQWQGLGKTEHDNEYTGLRRQWQRLVDLRASTSGQSTDPGAKLADVVAPPPRGVARSMLLPGAVGELNLQAVGHDQAVLVGRVTLALGLIAAWGVVVWLRQRVSWPVDVLPRSANVLGVIVGLAWWLWLAPSWFGWVIILLSVWLSLRSGLRTTTDSHSSIVRLPIATR
jgi:hypothetical protein